MKTEGRMAAVVSSRFILKIKLAKLVNGLNVGVKRKRELRIIAGFWT